MQVNVNGVVSFGKSFTSGRSRSLPLTGTDKIIAPYWADVDTRGTGVIYYRQTTDPSHLSRATSEIKAAYPVSQSSTITSLFIATWNSVGYFSRRTDKVGILCMEVCSIIAHSMYALRWILKNINIKTHGSVLCSPRNRCATPMSILTGRTIMQISHTRNFVLLVRNRMIFATEMPSTVSNPHSKFQLNHARCLVPSLVRIQQTLANLLVIIHEKYHQYVVTPTG